MDKNEFKEKLKAGMDKVVASSKKAFQKTETAVRKLSDQSVIRIEIRQFESKKKDEIRNLGQLAFEKFINDNTSVLSASDENVVKITNAIKEIEKEIQTRQEKLKALGEEPESPESTETPQTKTE
ncbi:MAG: hypothetical protein UIB61_02770 [Treponema sp.]|jgi:predicted  nucleic acid-binding Zn-ribbon protein|nr:hypothetical protein [Treponema sp.]